MTRRKILFITGTRADFGKMKPLMTAVDKDPCFELAILCTGMHLIEKYGYTINEIFQSGFDRSKISSVINQREDDPMELALSNTIRILSDYLTKTKVDLIAVHGDRVEALGASICGALRNIRVAHLEGGELSGTIDDLLRHATTKMSHFHFVASKIAETRLLQLGESKSSIFPIGSADIDIMLGGDLPSLGEAKRHYDIAFESFSIAIFHPVTTEYKDFDDKAKIFFNSLIESGDNFIVIKPNNDLGSNFIEAQIDRLAGHNKFKVFPSIRFEYFLTLLKFAKYIIGNSSAGIHEAPVFGVPTIDVGTRQMNRLKCESIFNVDYNRDEIFSAIHWASSVQRFLPVNHYGNGNTAQKFIDTLKLKSFWELPLQKSFRDIKYE